MKIFNLFIFLPLILLLSLLSLLSGCSHIERRWKQSSNDTSGNSIQEITEISSGDRENYNKRKIRAHEKNLATRQEKIQYSKLLPWFESDEERIQYLSQPSFEKKQEWIQHSGILSRQTQYSSRYKKLIDNQDIAIGMPYELVKKSWGDPLQVESSGNPIYKNEKWRYLKSVSSNEGFRQEKRTVYFEGGKVVGWESE